MILDASRYVPNAVIQTPNPPLQLWIQCSPQRTPKRPSSEPHGVTRQQAIAETPAKWSACQIPRVIVVVVVLVRKPHSQKPQETLNPLVTEECYWALSACHCTLFLHNSLKILVQITNKKRFYSGLWIYGHVQNWHRTDKGANGRVVGWDTMLQACRSRVRVPMRSIYLILTATLCPAVYSASDRNEYQKHTNKCFCGVERGQCVGLTTLPPSVSRLSRLCWFLNVSQPYRPARPVTAITLLYFLQMAQGLGPKRSSFFGCPLATSMHGGLPACLHRFRWSAGATAKRGSLAPDTRWRLDSSGLLQRSGKQWHNSIHTAVQRQSFRPAFQRCSVRISARAQPVLIWICRGFPQSMLWSQVTAAFTVQYSLQ
jgi:hypothetical protein